MENEGRERRLRLPKYCRFALVPVLLILVVPLYIYVPVLHRRQLLKLINDTVTIAKDPRLYGA